MESHPSRSYPALSPLPRLSQSPGADANLVPGRPSSQAARAWFTLAEAEKFLVGARNIENVLWARERLLPDGHRVVDFTVIVATEVNPQHHEHPK